MAAAQEPDVPSWVGDGELALLEEDDERNRKQALRNRKIRGLLKIQRDEGGDDGAQPDVLGEFESVAVPEMKQEDAEVAPPWFVARDKPSSVTLRLHEELLDLAEFLRPRPYEQDARWGWASTIEAAARELWPRCGVHVFGSTATGLGLPCADVDVAVTEVEGLRVTTAMKKLAERLLERQEVSRVEIVQSARVPVMKVQHRSTGIWADVVINRRDGLETTQFICGQLQAFPALGPLVLFMKIFLLQRRLQETFSGGMGSYVLVCIVLSFLQRHPSARLSRVHSTASLGQLLLDMLKYYGHEFRYGTSGISVRGGGSIFDRVARGWTGTTRSGQPTLCLESPADASVDIGSRIFKIGVVRAAMIHAYHTLSGLILDQDSSLGKSLLCPHLLRRGGAVIANRYETLQQQPNPFLQLPPREEDEGEELGEVDEAPLPRKRARLLGTGSEVSDPIGDALDTLVAGVRGAAQGPSSTSVLELLVDRVIKAEAGEEGMLATGGDDDTEASNDNDDDGSAGEEDYDFAAEPETEGTGAAIAQLGSTMGEVSDDDLLEVD